MQFDDGTEDITPGDHIIMETDSSTLDLGPANYDSDHDGVADSVIIADGDMAIVVTDSDHDGDPDSVTAYNADGHQVDPRTGEPINPSTDPSTDPGTQGPTVDPVSHDDPGQAPVSQDPGNAPYDDPSTDPHNDPSDPSHAPAGHDGGITVVGNDGSPVTVGDPTVDIDKDGQPDTAVVKGADGSTTGYTDRDGDGQADQITQISADGKVVIAVAEDGGWHVVATGHIDADGSMVQDASPDPNAQIHAPTTGDDHGQQDPSTPHTDPQTGPTVDPQNGPTVDPQGDPHTDPHTDPQTAPAGDITVSKDGQAYDLGSPNADMNGDGKADTVVTKQADGTLVGFTDVDGNGTADRITQITPDGKVVIAEQDESGQWQPVATGHVDGNGQYVPDQTNAGATAGI